LPARFPICRPVKLMVRHRRLKKVTMRSFSETHNLSLQPRRCKSRVKAPNFLVGFDGPDTIFGGLGRGQIIGGSPRTDRWRRRRGSITTQGAPRFCCQNRHDQLFDGAGGQPSLHTNVTPRYINNTNLTIDCQLSHLSDRAGRSRPYTPVRSGNAYGPRSSRLVQHKYPLYYNTVTVAGRTISIAAHLRSGFLQNHAPRDLQAFDGAFGLPNPTGRMEFPPGNRFRSNLHARRVVELETRDRRRWAHAMAPMRISSWCRSTVQAARSSAAIWCWACRKPPIS